MNSNDKSDKKDLDQRIVVSQSAIHSDVVRYQYALHPEVNHEPYVYPRGYEFVLRWPEYRNKTMPVIDVWVSSDSKSLSRSTPMNNRQIWIIL